MCSFVEKEDKHTEYLFFVKTTLILLSSQKSNKPDQIINMEGLNVEEHDETCQFGFTIKHRDGIYPEKKFYFETK